MTTTQAAKIVADVDFEQGDNRRELTAAILRAGGREVYNANDDASLVSFYPTIIWELTDGSRVRSDYSTLMAVNDQNSPFWSA